MSMPKDSFQINIQRNVLESWQEQIKNMEQSLNILEQGLDEAEEMMDACTDEWCMATEHVVDELGNWLFSISEPAGAPEEDSRKLKALKRRLHDLYTKYKGTSGR